VHPFFFFLKKDFFPVFLFSSLIPNIRVSAKTECEEFFNATQVSDIFEKVFPEAQISPDNLSCYPLAFQSNYSQSN